MTERSKPLAVQAVERVLEEEVAYWETKAKSLKVSMKQSIVEEDASLKTFEFYQANVAWGSIPSPDGTSEIGMSVMGIPVREDEVWVGDTIQIDPTARIVRVWGGKGLDECKTVLSLVPKPQYFGTYQVNGLPGKSGVRFMRGKHEEERRFWFDLRAAASSKENAFDRCKARILGIMRKINFFDGSSLSPFGRVIEWGPVGSYAFNCKECGYPVRYAHTPLHKEQLLAICDMERHKCPACGVMGHLSRSRGAMAATYAGQQLLGGEWRKDQLPKTLQRMLEEFGKGKEVGNPYRLPQAREGGGGYLQVTQTHEGGFVFERMEE